MVCLVYWYLLTEAQVSYFSSNPASVVIDTGK